MPKRKRSEPTGSQSPERSKPKKELSLSRRKKLCIQRIEAAQKPLIAALRHAAGLERQKHSRRKKTAQSKKDAKQVARIDAEYAFLKSIELEKLASQHLHKTIGKVKSLKDNEAMPDSVRHLERSQEDERLLSVKSRLFKVDSVRRAVEEAISDLKEIVGAGVTAEKVAGTDNTLKNKKDTRTKSNAKEGEDTVPALDIDYDSDRFAALDGLIAAPSSAEDDSEDSLSDGHRPPSIQDSDSEGGAGNGHLSDTAGSEDDLEDGHALQISGSDDGTSSEIESASIDNDEDSDEAPVSLPKAKRKAVDTKTTADSKFLPTLSHAAYFSGSESEASDIEAEVAPRKNRRGQRARQKIWEQKYKEKAKHMQKQGRDQGWDPRRGAVADGPGRFGGRGRDNERPRGRGPEISGANELPLGPKKLKRDDAGTLHPSWQAAKAAKEKKTQVKPQGKKVVFE